MEHDRFYNKFDGIFLKYFQDVRNVSKMVDFIFSSSLNSDCSLDYEKTRYAFERITSQQ